LATSLESTRWQSADGAGSDLPASSVIALMAVGLQ
jgi:hypothetical protein